MEETKAQLDYPLLAESYPNNDPKYPMELVCENLCPAMPSIELDEETPPMAEVKAWYRDLGFEHMACGLDYMRTNINRIRNIKACCLRLLYQAPVKTGCFSSVPVGKNADLG